MDQIFAYTYSLSGALLFCSVKNVGIALRTQLWEPLEASINSVNKIMLSAYFGPGPMLGGDTKVRVQSTSSQTPGC